jgi:hypothetical protein
MRFIELVPGKVLYALGRKIASRTVLGYMFHLKYGNFQTDNPSKEIREKIALSKEVSDNVQRLNREYRNYPIRFCVVRDPVDRFVSAFANKLNNDPTAPVITLDQVIQNIDTPEFIQQNEKFLMHIHPQVEMYGADTSVYTNIFSINQIDQIKAMIEQQTGTTLPNLHLNKNNPEKIPVVTDAQREWIRNRYQQDYTVYGQWM